MKRSHSHLEGDGGFDSTFDSNEKRDQRSPAFSISTGFAISPVNIETAPDQKFRAATFACITRTFHNPGNRLHTWCAA